MAKINGLDKYSYAELLELKDAVETAITERKAAEAREVKANLEAVASKAGFSLDELFGSSKGKRKSATVKYRNPKDSTQTWTGRGRKPNWLVDAVKKGAKLQSFAV